MSLIIHPSLPIPGSEAPVQRVEKGRDPDQSFAGHLDRHLDEKYAGNRDKLGVESRRCERKRAEKAENSQKAEENSDAEKKTADSASELLAQFMAELQEVAGQSQMAPGEWKVSLPDAETLQQLAENAGMDETAFMQFMQQIGMQENEISLDDFFKGLETFFEGAGQEPAITVPETELPMLEALLAKMGVPENAISEIAQQAVTRDGSLDLSLFLNGLKEIDKLELTPVTLSESETEQLQSLLAKAGLTLAEQNELLPERFLNQVLGNPEAGEAAELSLARLKDLLQQSINDVQARQPKVDLPSFVNDLQKIISQSAFENSSVGWTPVVQETVTALFQKLQELVDLARVKVVEGRAMEEFQFDEETGKWFKIVEEKYAFQPGQDGESDLNRNFQFGHGSMQEIAVTEQPVAQPESSTVFAMPETNVNSITSPEAARAAAQVRTFSPHLQQQLVQQLTSGVVRGLNNQEHHLVLRLYPQDLGEVKVNLLIRDEQVSVSFKMENSRVKEMLESNMEEFKESMTQKGFTLGECSVSVGQQDDGAEQWQRFELARQLVRDVRQRMADMPEDALYLQGMHPGMDDREDGINLIV